MACKIIAACIFASFVLAIVIASTQGGYRPPVWPEISTSKTGRLPPMQRNPPPPPVNKELRKWNFLGKLLEEI